MLRIRKPFLGGTSNSRQGDPHGWVRAGNKPFHRGDHECCSALSEAEFLLVSSIPGLSIYNYKTHTVPRFSNIRNFDLGGFHSSERQKFGGLTLNKLVQKLSIDPEFNGHFCLWMRDNDGDHIFKHRESPDLGLEKYVEMLTEVFRNAEIERIYLTTVPLRRSYFEGYEDNTRVSVAECVIKFNQAMRRVFGSNTGRKINKIPVTLVDLNLCFEETDMHDSKYYCTREKDKVHINARFYVKFLSLLNGLLEEHSGLSDQSIHLNVSRSSTVSSSHNSSNSSDEQLKNDKLWLAPATKSASTDDDLAFYSNSQTVLLEDTVNKSKRRGKNNSKRKLDIFYKMESDCLD